MFKVEMSVRDYECDLQGIVNNSVYLNYLEYARHEYLKSIGFNFAELVKNEINLVVIRAELDYKFPLKPEDIFDVTVDIQKLSKVRFIAKQEIFRKYDNKLILKAKLFFTIIDNNGGIKVSSIFDEYL